jgi:hypothetical protein
VFVIDWTMIGAPPPTTTSREPERILTARVR